MVGHQHSKAGRVFFIAIMVITTAALIFGALSCSPAQAQSKINDTAWGKPLKPYDSPFVFDAPTQPNIIYPIYFFPTERWAYDTCYILSYPEGKELQKVIIKRKINSIVY